MADEKPRSRRVKVEQEPYFKHDLEPGTPEWHREEAKVCRFYGKVFSTSDRSRKLQETEAQGHERMAARLEARAKTKQ